MNKSIKEKLLFLLKENIISSIAVVIILISVFFNRSILLWCGIAIYIVGILIKGYIFRFAKKKNNEKKEGKVIDFNDKRIK